MLGAVGKFRFTFERALPDHLLVAVEHRDQGERLGGGPGLGILGVLEVTPAMRPTAVRSTLATSQLPIEKWHDIIGDPTLADAILDRLVHNAYKINLKGGSMRKRKANLTRTTQAE